MLKPSNKHLLKHGGSLLAILLASILQKRKSDLIKISLTDNQATRIVEDAWRQFRAGTCPCASSITSKFKGECCGQLEFVEVNVEQLCSDFTDFQANTRVQEGSVSTFIGT